MQRYFYKRAGRKILDQTKIEGDNARKAISSLTSIISESWHTIIECIPKMIRLSIELIKSDKVSDRAKLTLIGGVFISGVLISGSFVGVMTIFPIVALFAGPISAVILLPFYGAIKMFLLTVTLFVMAHTFNSLIQSDEVEKLAVSLFGDMDGKQFLAKMQSIYNKLKKYLGPLADKLSAIFEKIGKTKKANFNPDTDGDTVIRTAKDNMNKLIEAAGTSKLGPAKLLPEGNE